MIQIHSWYFMLPLHTTKYCTTKHAQGTVSCWIRLRLFCYSHCLKLKFGTVWVWLSKIMFCKVSLLPAIGALQNVTFPVINPEQHNRECFSILFLWLWPTDCRVSTKRRLIRLTSSWGGLSLVKSVQHGNRKLKQAPKRILQNWDLLGYMYIPEVW